jgi:hypothetical protein
VFDFIFGHRYFALSTFLRVAAISITALGVSIFAIEEEPISTLRQILSEPAFYLVFTTLNVLFDYILVTKSRFLIATIAKSHKKYAVIIFIFADIILTIIIAFVYGAIIFGGFDLAEFGPVLDTLILVMAIGTWVWAFALTTFLTVLLTTVYSISLILLMFVNFLGKTTYMRWLVPENIVSLLRWMLPVETLPVRSIGIVAGAFVFLFVAAVRAVT